MKKKLVLMTSALMAISLLAGCGNKHVHNWGVVVYEWSTDHKSCTATRVCKDDERHKETETKDSVYAVTKEAKCEEDGSGRYTVTFDNEGLGIAHFDITLEAIGHEWGEVTYTWSDDYSSCTATRVCKNDSNHIESETADSAYTEIIPATCDTDGSAVYDVAFENKAFEAQSHEITLPATGHSWGTPTYTWSDDYSSCTATRVCKNDSNHIESETADSAYTEIIPATCDTDGSAVYDVAFENKAFEAQSHEITLPATGHSWGTPTYTWSEDNKTCTAKRVCAHDATHVDTETVNSTYVVVEEAKCEEDGTGRYTADFTKEAFADQTKDITLEAVGHNLTAHDAHAETCKKAGNSAYWSCERCGKFYSDAEGKNEIKNDSWIIPAHAHDLIHNSAKAATCYVPGNIEYWVCKECFQYFSDEACEHPIDQKDVRTPAHHTLTHHEAKNATRLEDGNIEYWSCDVCGKYFSDEEGKNEIDEESIIIPALGTDKSYFNGTFWHDSSFNYTLSFGANNFSNYDIDCEYYFSSFSYDDETKGLSFIVTGVESFGEYPSPYEVGDKISFTYNAEKDVLMFGTIELSKQ